MQYIPVLILSYSYIGGEGIDNISLKNYIHDKISEVRDDFSWENFDIINYHQFFKSEANNYCMRHNSEFENELFFESVKDKVLKYNAIFIDEVQDYKIEWLRIIKRYFLAEGGEYVLFGDEKQNIYNRDLELDKRSKTNILGRWNELNETFRLSTKIANIAIKFQKYFFSNRYEIDEIKVIPQQTISDYEIIPNFGYYFFANTQENYSEIYAILNDVITKSKVHPNDVCILCTKRKTIRELDFLIRIEKNEKTEIMCETKEMNELLRDKGREKEINNIRRNKKFHFWMNPGTIKLSTIHSFKGWEIHTLFLIIEPGFRHI
ncbi:hypothetical protein ig2599ANME_1433 [groundwater metagenome]